MAGGTLRAACGNCHGTNIEFDPSQGSSVCVGCGAVLEENVVVSEVQFSELATGASVLQGQFISSERGKAAAPSIFGRRMDAGESREVTIAHGRRRIQEVAVAVGGLAGEHFIDTAHRWYILALQHQFTRGRRAPNIVAACLYIVCRQERTPHMLLDFADVLQTSVYSLGGTFLRLVRLLNLEIPLIDPSFYVGRFAARLDFGEKTQAVSNTALRLMARMKRDWIQTGRRPAGVCAAGLIVAARIHGFRRTEAEVVRVVRICEATLRRRLEEFGDTPSSKLTPEEFEGVWLEHEVDPPSFKRARRLAGEQQAADAGQPVGRLTALTLAPTPHPATPPPAFEVRPFEAPDETTFSDLDGDEEVESVLLGKEEVAVKTRVWSTLNKDYLREEAEKARLLQAQESAGKAGKPGREATPADRTAGRRRARKQAAKGSGEVAETAAEAARQVLAAKKVSKRLNYDTLNLLLTAEQPQQS